MDGLLMKYFVLKPSGNDKYAAASRAAMRRYARLIQHENPELASGLTEWADREFANAVDAPECDESANGRASS